MGVLVFFGHFSTSAPFDEGEQNDEDWEDDCFDWGDEGLVAPSDLSEGDDAADDFEGGDG